VSLIFSMKKILGGLHNMFSPWPASYQIPFKIGNFYFTFNPP
jgi:hypothetical protein